MKNNEKTQLSEARSHYRLFMNVYSRMLRHQKLRQSMDNTLQVTFTTRVAFLSEILSSGSVQWDSAHVVGQCTFQLVVPHSVLRPDGHKMSPLAASCRSYILVNEIEIGLF